MQGRILLDRLVIEQIVNRPKSRATNLIKKSSSKSQKTLRVGSKNSSSAKRFIIRNSYIAVEGIVLIIIDGICSTYNKRVYYIKLMNTLVWKNLCYLHVSNFTCTYQHTLHRQQQQQQMHQDTELSNMVSP